MRALLYTRVSTPQQAKKHGTAYQRAELTAYCQARGWDIAEVIVDDAMKGKRIDRPGLDRVMEFVRAQQVDVVLVWRLDRLFRSLRDLLNTIHEFDERKVALVASGQQVDTTTSMGKAMLGLAGIFAELESDIARERTLAGLAQARAAGRPIGGAAHQDQVRLTPEEARALVAKHGSIRGAARAIGCSSTTIHRRLAMEAA